MAAAANPARLFIGNLPWDTEEPALQSLFASCGTVVKCEIPKGRQGRSRGYGIIEFSSPHEAQLAVQQLHGHHVGDRDITVREDKAMPPKSAPERAKAPGKAAASAAPPAADGCRVYVGNLAWETTEEELFAHCQSAGAIVHAEVARQSSGRSKGWALVDYSSPADAAQAIATLHNTELRARSVIVRLERTGPAPSKGERPPRGERAERTSGAPARPENSSGRQIVVRNLPWTTTSEDLREVFQQVGTVHNAVSVCHADTGRSKGWGTVLFETPEQAQAAIAGFNGVELESRPMQIKLDRYE